MTGSKVCLNPQHATQHGTDKICPVCSGEVLRFMSDDDPNGLDDLWDAAPEPEIRETLVVTTRSGFTLHLEEAGTDNYGNQLWRQLSANLGKPKGKR